MIKAEVVLARFEEDRLAKEKEELDRKEMLNDLDAASNILGDFANRKAQRGAYDTKKRLAVIRRVKEFWLKTFDEYVVKTPSDSFPIVFNIFAANNPAPDIEVAKAALNELKPELEKNGWTVEAPSFCKYFYFNFKK